MWNVSAQHFYYHGQAVKLNEAKTEIIAEVDKPESWRVTIFNSRISDNEQLREYLNHELTDVKMIRFGNFGAELYGNERKVEIMDKSPITSHNVTLTNDWSELSNSNKRLDQLSKTNHKVEDIRMFRINRVRLEDDDPFILIAWDLYNNKQYLLHVVWKNFRKYNNRNTVEYYCHDTIFSPFI